MCRYFALTDLTEAGSPAFLCSCYIVTPICFSAYKVHRPYSFRKKYKYDLIKSKYKLGFNKLLCLAFGGRSSEIGCCPSALKQT